MLPVTMALITFIIFNATHQISILFLSSTIIVDRLTYYTLSVPPVHLVANNTVCVCSIIICMIQTLSL